MRNAYVERDMRLQPYYMVEDLLSEGLERVNRICAVGRTGKYSPDYYAGERDAYEYALKLVRIALYGSVDGSSDD